MGGANSGLDQPIQIISAYPSINMRLRPLDAWVRNARAKRDGKARVNEILGIITRPGEDELPLARSILE